MKSCFLINYVYIFLELTEAQYIHWNGKILHMCEKVYAFISIKLEYLNIFIYHWISISDNNFCIYSRCVINYGFYVHRLSQLANYEQDSKIQFVIDAVYAFAYALDALKSAVCPTWKGVCPAMSSYDGGEFYKKYLLAVDFKGKFIQIGFCATMILLSRYIELTPTKSFSRDWF